MKPDRNGRHHSNWNSHSSEQHDHVMPMLNRFRRAAKIIVMLMKGFRQTKIYFQDEEVELKIKKSLRTKIPPQMNNDDVDDDDERRSPVSSAKYTISHQLLLGLTILPQHRNDATIRQILWFLKAMKAFQNLFPVEMEQEVAKYVEYARYDDGRVIANQGRRPEYLYFIISGRVKLVRQFRLVNGVVTKLMSYVPKGKTTDPDELSGQRPRENTLVARGQVEMLLLNKEVFAHLQHTTDGPPLDFIRSLRFFQRFPVESFLDNPDSIEYSYYGDGKVVVKDSNRSAWIYIIKSGFVKVVRCQMVKYSRTFQKSSEWAEEGKVAANRRRTNKKVMVKINIEEIHFPKVCEFRLVNEPHQPLKKQHQKPSSSIENEYRKLHNTKTGHRNGGSRGRRCRRLFSGFEAIAEENSTTTEEMEENSSGNIPPSSRETEKEDLRMFPLLNQKDRGEKQRMTFLQLDTLTTGDIFGLDHLHPVLASEPKGVSLVSGGAEVIKIRKRFYMNFFGNEGLHATDLVCKEYISEMKAEQDLLNQESWRRYKESVYREATAACYASSANATTSSRCINR